MFGIGMEDHRPSLIIDGVAEEQQTMSVKKTFWPFFTSNLNLGYWLVGVLLAVMDLDITTAVIVVLLGNLIASIPPSLLALMGPRTGLTQMESSRASFGKRGIIAPSIINWISCIGWDAINNVPSAAAFVGFAALVGFGMPFWVALLLLVISQMIIGIYGHDLVQAVQKWMGLALFITFAAIGIFTAQHGSFYAMADKHVTVQAFVLGVALIASVNMSWSPYASDYTRYLPRSTPGRAIFWRVFLGMFVSAVLMELIGVITASQITDQTPAGIMEAIKSSSGIFAPIALLIIALSSIPVNAINDNTGAYSLISAGIRIRRQFSAVIASLIGFALAVYGAGQFTTFLENILLLVIYWIAPWGAIVLVDWFYRKEAVDYPTGWASGATVWVISTVGTIALFPATTYYTGPVARALDGLDIGYYVGFVVAGLWYWLLLKARSRKANLA